MVTTASDPVALRSAIDQLRAVVEQAPPGETRWSMRGGLADALVSAGRSGEALPFYEQAAAEAEAASHWADVGWISQNWAVALQTTGNPTRAKATYLRSAKAKEKAGSRRINILMSELEVLRIDVQQGQTEAALPEIDGRLDELRAWWKRSRSGKSVPEAPNPVYLALALVSALDIAYQANQALERWQPCLDLLAESEQAERDLGETEQKLARTRFNQYGPLTRMGRLNEAQDILESCLAVFGKEEAIAGQAGAASGLADVWNERGDTRQAAGLERQALVLRNRLPDPADRAISHGNLAAYLEKAGQRPQAARHELAAGSYFLLCGHGQHLAIWRRNLAIGIRRAAQAGQCYELPRLADLLADPEFDALQHFLTANRVDPADLQSDLDQLVDQVRKELS